MDFRILGPLEVFTDGRPVPLAAAKQRALLALLLLNANQVVSSDRLMDELWGEGLPATAGNTLQVYVSQLRRALGGGSAARELLATRSPGYVLIADDAEIDARRFERLVEAGRAALADGAPAIGSVKLREALALWRGPALADFALEDFASAHAERLEEVRLGAIEDRIECDLELGRGVELVPELEAMAGEHPLRERVRQHLMVALYRAGRQADALAAYQKASATLADELGIDPTPSTQALYQQILRQDPSLLAVDRTPAAPPSIGAGADRAAEESVGAVEPSDVAPMAVAVDGAPTAAEGVSRTGDQLLPVTALFADVVGSTALAERLTPDEVRVVIGDCVTRMSREAERFGGTVQAYMGDGICVYFGVPLAHEDDPERAALAALAILRVVNEQAREVELAWGIGDFGVRVGINSGKALVGLVGAGVPQTVAFGDAINVAARLQGAADPGSVLVGDDVARVISPRFCLDPVGEVELKGRDEPIAAWRLLCLRSEPESVSATPMIGRTRELELLSASVRDLRAGRGQVLLVRGDAGLGKTRMLSELRQIAGEDALWLEGRCPPPGVELAYGPLVELVRAWLGVFGDEPEVAIRTRLRTRLAELGVGDDPELRDHLARVLSISPDPAAERTTGSLEELRVRDRDAFRAWVEALTEREPVVLAIDDLHNADAATRGFLEQLLPSTDRSPLLLTATSRPEPSTEGWSFWLTCLTDFAHRTVDLILQPLTEGQSGELADVLAPVGVLDDDTRREILARAEGNPLYLEELIRTLSEGGGFQRRDDSSIAMTVIGFRLPPALENLLIVRIQRLPPGARRLAEFAAVIGREFPLSLLGEVAGSGIDVPASITDLLHAEVITEVRRRPEVVYRFAHALMQEAARSTIPPARVRHLNTTVARSLLSLHGDESEHIERIAGYAYRGDDEVLALDLLERAADRATSGGDVERGARLLRRAQRVASAKGDQGAEQRLTERLALLHA